MPGPYVHSIDPILFDVGGVHLWWYGLGYTLGFLEILLFLRHHHRQLQLSPRDVWSLALFMACGVLIGGRAIEIAFDEWPFYRDHVWLVPAYWLGGMATHGLMFGGALAAGLFAFLYRKPFLPLADALVIPAALLMGLGRLGNFIDGQIVGAVTDVPWAVQFPDAEGFRHPVVLYDGAKNLVLMAYLLHVRRTSTTPGAVAARFVFWYAFPRFFIDLFRDYPTHRLALGTGQTLNIVMALLGVVLLYRSRLRRLGRLTSHAVSPSGDSVSSSSPLWSQRVAFACLLAFCLTMPSNWTQDIPARYGARHPGLTHSWLYPEIDTDPPPSPTGMGLPAGGGVPGLAFLGQLAVTPVLAATQVPTRAPTRDTVIEPRSGIPFPVSLMPPGGSTPQWIMGTGLRDRTIFRIKIYAFGLYVDPAGARAALSSFAGRSQAVLEDDEAFYRRLLELPFAMTLRLVMTRTVGGDDLAEAFDDALRPRMAQAIRGPEGAAAAEALETVAGYFDREGEVRSGAEIVFACATDGTLTASVDGEPRPRVISVPICRALFDVYLGEHPVSKVGKRSVIAGFPGLLLASSR